MAGLNSRIEPLAQQCPKCGKAITRYTHAQSKYFGCPSCQAWLKINGDGSLKPVPGINKTIRKLPVPLQPGQKFVRGDKTFIIVAWAEKADSSARQYKWREYTLFHPLHGYRWVSEYDGHWIFLERRNIFPKKTGLRELTVGGKSYQLFQKYRSVVISAAGEFPGNIYADTVRCEEFIAPPYMLSVEGGKSYKELLFGESLTLPQLEEATGKTKEELPRQTGIGAVQVKNMSFSQPAIFRLTVYALVLMILVFSFSGTRREQQVATINMTMPDSLVGTTIASKPFVLDGRTSDLRFEYSSDVSNNWSEADIMLVNDKTNEARGITMGTEYYSGVDDGGSWTEGSQFAEKLMSSVSPGIYHINMTQTKGGTGTGGNTFLLNVVYDVSIPSNFFLLAFLMLIIPVSTFLLRRNFEKNRWMNSDYSPYDTEE